VRTGSVFPELVTGREDEFAGRRWRVREGSTRRGEASCDLGERILEVPLGADETARVVRAHELMHSRVSPHELDWERLLGDIAPRALECAEEFRVNTLLGRLGFDVSLLSDGSEKSGGRRLAQSGDWGQAVCFLLAVLGTGAERDYLSGIRSGDPSWLPGLRAVRKRALAIMDCCPTPLLGATKRDEDGVPGGYAASTVVLARVVTQTMAAVAPVGPEALRQFRRSLEPGGRRPPTGTFAGLSFAPGDEFHRRARSSGVRRVVACTSGTAMRYPGRLLTDPQQRAFARVAHRHGGVVVIDQSGSMDIDVGELDAMLRRAPDALVVGYSHRPGDRGATPNVWVLAARGVVASSPSGNVGNGVDGPVLRWALDQRRGTEPLIWVTDGQVTDSHDHACDALTTECAELVVRHRIRLVRQVADVTRCLGSGSSLKPASTVGFGRIGRKIAEIRAM
jgi:hypothetical protein